MSYYTVTRTVQLAQVSDLTQLMSALGGTPTGPTLNAGDLVSTSDPPQTAGAFTQVTTTNGQQGWVPTNAISQGMGGSTVMNIGIIGAILIGGWLWWRSR